MHRPIHFRDIIPYLSACNVPFLSERQVFLLVYFYQVFRVTLVAKRADPIAFGFEFDIVKLLLVPSILTGYLNGVGSLVINIYHAGFHFIFQHAPAIDAV